MSYLISSVWEEFEPLVFLLNNLPEKQAIDYDNLPAPTLFCINLTHIEISYMDLDADRLRKILSSLTKINELVSLKISFFFHCLRADEMSQLFLEFIPQLSPFLNEFQVSFSQNEFFSLKNFEEIGETIGSLKNLQNLELFFEGILFFDEVAIVALFSKLPSKMISLTVKFLSSSQIKSPGLQTLAHILNKSPIKNLTIYIKNNENPDMSVIPDFAAVYQPSSLESLSLKTSKTSQKIFITDIEPFEVFFKRLSGLNALYLKLDFPLYPVMQEKIVYVAEKLNFLRNLTILHLQSSSGSFLFGCMPFLENFSKLISLELIEKPQDPSNAHIFLEKNILQLYSLKKQLVHLKLIGFSVGNNKFFEEEFKFLTEVNSQIGFSLASAQARRRKRKVFIAWILKEKLRKSKVIKRYEILDEMLGYMPC